MKRAIHTIKRAIYSIFRHTNSRTTIPLKEPFFLSLKEPYILWKEPYVLSKEPYILYFVKRTLQELFRRKSPLFYHWKSHIFYEKSPTCYQKSRMFYHQKSPICYQKSPTFCEKSTIHDKITLEKNFIEKALHSIIKRALFSVKRALRAIKRALYSLKIALYTVMKWAIKKTLYSMKRALHTVQRDQYQKSPVLGYGRSFEWVLHSVKTVLWHSCSLSKEPYLLWKEQYILSKEPCSWLWKQIWVGSTLCQKSTITLIWSVKRALYSIKRALHTIKWDQYQKSPLDVMKSALSGLYTLSKESYYTPMVCQKSPTYYQKRQINKRAQQLVMKSALYGLYTLSKAAYYNLVVCQKSPIVCQKSPIVGHEVSFILALHSVKRGLLHPCSLSKEPYTLSKEPYSLSKEPYSWLYNELYMGSTLCQKRPITPLHSVKRAL